MIYIGLTDSDYDEKLREMGNYLWDLEQQADLARAEGRQAVVDQIESKILAPGGTSAHFPPDRLETIVFWQPLSPVSGTA